MSTEGDLLSAVLNDKHIHILMQANVDSLLTTHADIWKTIKDHYNLFGGVPSYDQVKKRHPDFDYNKDIKGTEYLLDEVRNEFLDSGVRAMIMSAAGYIQDKKTNEALDKVINDAAKLKRMTSRVRDIDAADADAAASYYELVEKQRENGGLGVMTGLAAFDIALPSGIMPGHFGVILAYPSIGKAMPMSTPVLTPTGWVANGDLNVGDNVIGVDGKPTKIIGIPYEGIQDSYLVTTNDGGSVICGPEHLWTVQSRDGRYTSGKTQTLTTLEILDRGLLLKSPSRQTRSVPGYKWFLPIVSPVEHETQDFIVDPYTMGFLIGDGSMTRETVYFTTDDEFCADKIAKLNPELNVNKHNKLGAQRYSITPRYMDVMRKLGLNTDSHHKRIPDQYFIGSVGQRVELLRGLMDSDGSCTKGSKAVFSTRNMGLAEDVQSLVWSLGGTAKIAVCDRGEKGVDIIVSIWTPMNPFSLPRKAERYTVRPGYRAIKSIEKIGSEHMRCISVANEDGLFVTKDYIVTHNSWLMAYFAVQAWRNGKTPLIISLEMTEAEVRNRIYTIIGDGRWSHRDLSAGKIDRQAFREWHQKVFAGKPPIHIISSDSEGGVTPIVVQGKIDQYKPSIVLLDYLNLMDSNDRAESETVKMKQLSRQLKLAAVSDNVPIVAISSATPDNVSDMNSAPTLGQVSWSKQISYDADWLIALGRETNSDVIQVVFRKNRHGVLGEFYLTVDFDKGQFIYRGIDP